MFLQQSKAATCVVYRLLQRCWTKVIDGGCWYRMNEERYEGHTVDIEVPLANAAWRES